MKSGKTESVAEFMARGGKINKVQTNVGKRSYARKTAVSKSDIENIDYSALPQALKIKYGVK